MEIHTADPLAAVGIRRVMAGERVVDPDLALSTLSDGNNPLTGRIPGRHQHCRYRRKFLPLWRLKTNPILIVNLGAELFCTVA